MEYNIFTSSPSLARLANMGWSEPHASHFNAGSVTFVGKRETGNMLRSFLVDIHGGNHGI